MKRKIIHLHKVIDTGLGATISTTLCGKQQWQGGSGEDGGGNNITENPNEVTCKLCLKDRRFPKTSGDAP